MRGAEHRLLDGDAGLVRAEQHGAARPRIARIRQDALVVLARAAAGVAREEIGDLGAPQRDERLTACEMASKPAIAVTIRGWGHGERWIEIATRNAAFGSPHAIFACVSLSEIRA